MYKIGSYIPTSEKGANDGVAQLDASGKLLSSQVSLASTTISTDVIFTDSRATKKGLEYAGDYSATFTARSLVDKAYVDANSGGSSIYTADGTLTGDRTVDTDGNKLTIDGSGVGSNQKIFVINKPSGEALSIDEDGDFLVSGSIRNSSFFGVEANQNGYWYHGTIRSVIIGKTNTTTRTQFNQNGTLFFNSSNSEIHRIGLAGGGSGQYLTFFKTGFGTGQRFLLGGTALISTEDISLQGNTVIKGADTLGTSSALQIYDGDSTPAVLWDFRNNGDVVLNQNANFVGSTNSFYKLSIFRPINAPNYGAYYSVDLYNSINSQTEYARFGANIVTNTNGNESGLAKISAVKNGTMTSHSEFDFVDGLTINPVSTTNLLKAGTVLKVSTSSVTATVVGGGGTPLTLYRDVGANNYGVNLELALKNSSNAQTTYGKINAKIIDYTAGSEDSELSLQIMDSGTLATKLTVKNNSIVLAENLDMDNNRITNVVVNPSVNEAASSATFTINADQQSDGVLTAMSANTTIAAPTGTPVQSQSLIFRFKDDGSARTLTWNAIFRAIGITLPTTTTASKLLYVGCKYNSTDTKWDVVSVQEEA